MSEGLSCIHVSGHVRPKANLSQFSGTSETAQLSAEITIMVLNFGHALPDDNPDSNQESAGNNKRAENLWQASGHIEDGAISFQLGVNKKGNRPVNPKK